MTIKKLLFGVLGAIILAVPLFALAVNISVPSAPGSNFDLVSTSTGAYIVATSTSYNAITYPGSDIGAKINAAYAACPSTGCQITVPAGTFTFTTPIVFGTNGKVVNLVCSVGGGFFDTTGTFLNYTGTTGTSTSINTNNFVTGGGPQIENCNFIGPAGNAGIGAIATSTDGIFLGGSNGAFGAHLDNVHISGFGTGLDIGSNVSFLNVTNSVINKNARDIRSPQVSGANGENMRVSNSVLADGNNNLFGNSISNYCVDIQLSGNVQWSFTDTSFDDCQLYSEQSGGTSNVIKVTNSHFEDPNTSQTSYDYVSSLSNQPAFTYVSTGNDYMQDFTSGAPTEYILSGGNVVLNGDNFSLNNNVTTPMQTVVTTQDSSSVDTVSWSGLTQGYANTSSSAAVLNVYDNHGFSPDGYGTGIANIGATFKVGLPTSTANGTTTIANLAGTLNATSFAGTGNNDIGDKINQAYAALPANGGVIMIPPGTYSFSTPIICGTNGKRCLIEGAPGGATLLNYTGTGTSTIINDGIQGGSVQHTSGNGIYGITFQGNSTSTTSPAQVGIQVGGSNGADGAVLNSANVEGFGIGFALEQNAYHMIYENSAIRNNGQNIHITAANNSGEALTFLNDFVVDGANNDASDCFFFDNSATENTAITGGSIDDCTLRVGQANNITLTGVSHENAGQAAWGSYPYIVIDQNVATNVVINGDTFFNDATTNSPPEFISNGGTLTLNGVIVRQFGGTTVTNFVVLTGSGRVSWTGFNNVSGTAVTNIVNTIGSPVNGTTANWALSALGTPAGTFLAADPNGVIIATTTPSGGSGTVTSVATTYPVTGGTFTTSGTIALAFGTTTVNNWSQIQMFNGGLTAYASSTIGNGGGTTGLTVNGNSTTTLNAYFAQNISIGTTTTAYPTSAGSLTINSDKNGADEFSLAARPNIGIPVPYLSPTANNQNIAFDIMPHGATVTNGFGSSIYGAAWEDICSNDVQASTSYECLHFGASSYGYDNISTEATGNGVVRNLAFQMNGGNVGIATSTPGSLLSLNGIANFTSATSTFYSTGGINLTSGCFSIAGTCVGGSGTVTSVTASAPLFSSGGTTPNITWAGLATTSNLTAGQLLESGGGAGVFGVATSTLTPSAPLGGSFTQVGTGGTLTCSTCLTANQTITLTGDVTGSGATSIATAFALGNSHWWTATQNFTNASTSQFTATSTSYFQGLTNFGSSNQSSMSSGGVLTLGTALATGSGGTGSTNLGTGVVQAASGALSAANPTRSFIIGVASTTALTGTTTSPAFSIPFGLTVTSWSCTIQPAGATAEVEWQYANPTAYTTATPTYLAASTTPGSVAIASNNTPTAQATSTLSVGNPSGSPLSGYCTFVGNSTTI